MTMICMSVDFFCREFFFFYGLGGRKTFSFSGSRKKRTETRKDRKKEIQRQNKETTKERKKERNK